MSLRPAGPISLALFQHRHPMEFTSFAKKMIRIDSIETTPIHEIPYEFPEQGGRVATASFPVFRVVGVGLPPPVQALAIMSDLQGREPVWVRPGKVRRLLGEAVAEDLAALSEIGELPPKETIGVVLAADLFVVPSLDKRGGKGDVRYIWRLCRDRFRWVSGIAGNHDRFGGDGRPPNEFLSGPGIYYF
jgi:hypothetical protein